uniref:Acetyl-coenzyme A carboxylase carboxyl transferase subunit beta, chloroplastic n=1 Tax=Teucrium stocksianum subsp. stocksianum TaxID=2172032 RepID=A0A4Y6I5C2_9LAMI|nr:acetyl-CoA carboxylase carboxyltransferase beta subunit [Teucrium stocksianum subsp. stocksianum]
MGIFFLYPAVSLNQAKYHKSFGPSWLEYNLNLLLVISYFLDEILRKNYFYERTNIFLFKKEGDSEYEKWRFGLYKDLVLLIFYKRLLSRNLIILGHAKKYSVLRSLEEQALEGFGVAQILQEMLTYKSDHIRARQEVLGTTIIGGTIPNPEDAPESFRLLVRELRSLAMELNHYEQMGFKEMVFKNGNNEMTSCIASYLQSQIYDTSVVSDSGDSAKSSDLTLRERSSDRDFSHLWVLCENCYELNYKQFLKSKMNICEQCGYHLQMSSSERIELSIDPDTWDPMDEDMFSLDAIGFHSEEEPYEDRIASYQKDTGLTEAVQTGVGQINGIPVAIGVMDFDFLGGSMGSVVGEKITRLIEYATNHFLPLIIVCASGGARMQEGSLSLMQMAKISSALYDYQSNKKLFYVSILTSPTTGGVTASFGMLGDIIIAEPNSYIAFAGKRVIEEIIKEIVPEDSQVTESLFEKGLFDLIVPRNLLKSVLGELFKLHAFFPLNSNFK